MFEYKTLYEICTLLNSEKDIRVLLKIAIDKVIETTKAQTGLLLVCDDNNNLLFECARHSDKVDIESPDSGISKTVIQKVLQSGESLIIENALDDPSFDTSVSIKALELASVACAPLKINEETFGVVYIDNKDFTAIFNENTRILLDELSKLISIQVKNSLEHRWLIEKQHRLQTELQKEKGYDQIIGNSSVLLKVFEIVDQVADTDTIVLITGETGTGKELIARKLHAKSRRRHIELVVLNCSTIPENLLEAELFGYEKGAFTGADKNKPGWFDTADEGTIFLDEIGELSLAAQVRLLRLIQFGEFTPIGSKQSKKVDVRIIAATNRDLTEMVNEGNFRKDLYYRLNVIEIKLPPLRERGIDVLQISDYFLKKYAKQSNKKNIVFSDEAKKILPTYQFPGNIRELENIVQRAVLLCKDKIIQVDDLNLIIGKKTRQTPNFAQDTDFKAAKYKIVSEFERNYLMARLRECNGNITKAAKAAKMYKKNFIDKMKQYGIIGEDFKTVDGK